MDAPHGWLFAHAQVQPHAPALDSPRHRCDYATLAARVRALAGTLQAQGLEPGERVLIALANSPAAAISALAVQAAGGCAAEVSPRLPRDALAAVLDLVGARFAFVDGADAQAWLAQPAFAAVRRIFVVGPAPKPELLPAARCTPLGDSGELESTAPELIEPAHDPERPSLILFTSGSTGTPRGVVLCARNLAANARAIAGYLELSERDRAMLILPLSYAYGRSVWHSHLLAGGSVFLDSRFMFPAVVLQAMAAEGCTGFAGVPSTFELLRRQLASLPVGQSLRYVTQAGGAMSRECANWVREAFAPARLFIMYGQTEATARLAYLPPDQLEAKLGSIGRAIPGVELRVADADGAELPVGEVGELLARGENIAAGYLGDPEATASTFWRGWLRTGDLARRDADGFIYLVGRAKEMLKISGHRVSPAQIEQVLGKHPAIYEAAVVGVADAVAGEVPVAFLVARGAPPTLEELRRFCRAELPAFMVPREFTFLDALPHNERGKLVRAELAERAARTARHESA